jgi:protein Tex
VGLYQHDVNQTALAEALTGVVETAVNQVGVDVNTASPALLTHVAGIGPKLAEKLWRIGMKTAVSPTAAPSSTSTGWAAKRSSRRPVSCASATATEPLDASAIHPESYGVATAVLQRANLSPATPPERARPRPTPPPALAQLAAELKPAGPP